MNIELLEKICMINGASGDEKAVRDFVISNLPGDCDYTVDPLGNLIVNKKGRQTPKNKVAVFAHADEVGLMARYITDDGYVYAVSVGGINDTAIFGKRFVCNGIHGVAAGKAVHLCNKDEREKIPKLADTAIDFGFESKEEAEKHIAPGDYIYFDTEFVRFGDGFIKSKALDDRLGVTIMLELLREDAEFDFTCVFTVQEEVGTRGAAAAAYTVRPDYAVVVESTTASDIADTPDHKKVCLAGKGPAISFMDRATVYSRELYRRAFETAERNNILCQPKTVVAGGNDAGAIHKAAGGIKVITVSLPCRYIHTSASVGAVKDMESLYDLVKALVRDFANG